MVALRPSREDAIRFEDVRNGVRGIPHATWKQGRNLYKAVNENGFTRCLELGFARGTSSAYIAAALDERGAGHLVSMDRPSALKLDPLATELLARLNLDQYVTFIYDEDGYNWSMVDYLKRGETFDFIYFDGAHTWDVDALAFQIADKMLVPGGMAVFDDMNWSIAESPSLANHPAFAKLSERQRTVQGVRQIVDLLVKPRADYEWLGEREGQGWARKIS